ncbi:hypothetical protein [Bradyrhizobium sp. BR 1433]|uniref:hypothetical protein n=1 Tax=Bradyrhizobium sp. BR 1433 TaxID=3447967 RepID=UPI003EE78538
MIDGLRNRPMAPAAVDRALAQANSFAQRLVDTYEVSVARGEVGENGSAQASSEPILANRSPNVLLYGRVQSGKTAAMVLSAALCLDNGFRVIVVLTSDNLALVEQTASRFRALSGPRVFSTRRLSDRYEWEGLEDDIRDEIARDGIVLVSAKNDIHLGRIMAFLQGIDAPSYPALIFDDEADAATPDTTVKAREEERPNAPPYGSAINRRVFENPKPGQEGKSLGEIFPHSVYVPVTATPFILFLQRPNSPTRPGETMLLEPGEGYCGGELFSTRSIRPILPSRPRHSSSCQAPSCNLSAGVQFRPDLQTRLIIFSWPPQPERLPMASGRPRDSNIYPTVAPALESMGSW